MNKTPELPLRAARWLAAVGAAALLSACATAPDHPPAPVAAALYQIASQLFAG